MIQYWLPDCIIKNSALPDHVTQAGQSKLTLLCSLCGEHGHRHHVRDTRPDELQQVHCEPLGVLQCKGGVGVVYPEIDGAHHQLLAVLAVSELGTKCWITLAPPHCTVSLFLQKLGQLRSAKMKINSI